MNWIKLVPLAFLVFLSGMTVRAEETRWELSQLMRALASVKQDEVDFVEKKYLAVLERPLVSTGKLFYKAPDYLKKQIITPRQESYEIKGDTLTIFQDGDTRVLDLARHPALHAFAVSLRSTLAGDLAELRTLYALDWRGDKTAWTLELEPLEERVAEYLAKIILAGEGARIHRVTTLDTKGDATILQLEPAS